MNGKVEFRKLPEVEEELKSYEELPEDHIWKHRFLLEAGTEVTLHVTVKDPELFRSVLLSRKDIQINTSLSVPGAELDNVIYNQKEHDNNMKNRLYLELQADILQLIGQRIKSLES